MTSRRFFVDTSALVALISEKDEKRRSAIEINKLILGLEFKPELVVTNFIVAEVHAMLLRDTALANDWLVNSAYQDFTVFRPDEEMETRARSEIKKYDDKDFSYADMLSFLTMEALGIKYYFAFDTHFAQIGKFKDVAEVLVGP